MGSKSNQILMGVIVLLLGIIILFQPSIGLNFGSIMFFACGIAFILLYITKRKSWSLVIGGYTAYIGIAMTISPHVAASTSLNLVMAMFFIVPAIIFFILYYDKNKRGLLIPACSIFWFGMFILIKDMSLFASGRSSSLFFCIGLSFLTSYVLGKGYIKKWALYISFAFLLMGALLFGGVGIFSNLPQFIAIVLIAFSLLIIINAMRKK